MRSNKIFLRISNSTRSLIRRIYYFFGLRKYESTETYKELIPAEITAGKFYALIGQIASQSDVETILEIGSSSGEGSTRALVEALRSKPQSIKQVHCLEVSKERHEKLASYLKVDSRFYPHRMSSVKASDFPPFEEIELFHSKGHTKISRIHIDTVKSWYKKDLQYLYDNPKLTPQSDRGNLITGIDWIKNIYRIPIFDFVIIDGGEFTGMAEYEYLQNSKYIALDDTNSFKNWQVREYLLQHKSYILVDEDIQERNGWAIFFNTLHKI